MPGVFRRRWFPRHRIIGFASKSASFGLSGVEATTQFTTLSTNVSRNQPLTGVSVTAQITAPIISISHDESLTGVAATATVGALVIGQALSLVGQTATAQLQVPFQQITTNPSLIGVAATTSTGTIQGDHPAKLLPGVQATTQVPAALFQSSDRLVFGVQAVAQINTTSFGAFKDVNLIGQRVTASAFIIGGFAAGGAGGGSSGPDGPGLRGSDGSGSGIGGTGGAGDNGNVPGPAGGGQDGNSGTEIDGVVGSGSGGAGADFGNNIGGDGGQYGGGGGGGTGGGHGIGGDAVIVLRWFGSGIWQEIVLRVADNVNSPLVLPPDWSNTNFVYIKSSGGCGSDGSFYAGGNGGGGGSILWGPDVPVFSPGQTIIYHISPGCEEGFTTFGDYSVENGHNATNTSAGLAGTHYTSWPGGIFYFGEGGTTGYVGVGIGGEGGSIFAFNYQGTEANPFSNFATAQAGALNNAGVPDDRTFIIAGIEQVPIAPGIVMLPTSESIAYGSNAPYIIGSSQFYTIGEVHWNGVKKTQGVDWQFVSPFKHMIEILHTAGITTAIQLIYYRWDIGVRAGFKVNSYPVQFGFTGTSIIAERVPPPGEFFTVEYTSTRPGNNPRSMFAIFPNMVDDFLTDHTLYDDASGFQTFRPEGWKIYDTSDHNVWEWNGSNWIALGLYSSGTLFYVKRLRQVYQYTTANGVHLKYTAGDGAAPTIDEVIDYPLFGESIGKNFLADAFSANAATLYPSAYEVSIRPGDYDTWVPGIDS